MHALEGIVRRGLDIAIAIISLLVATPIMLLILVLIRIDSPGSVLFSQTRLGLGGRPFLIYKFRKFRQMTSSFGSMITLKNDPRMTRIGKILERAKLDELPQLWNVLTGDMAMVGPRPEALAFADCFTGSFRRVLDFKPGLFGPSQSIFRNESAIYPEDCDPHEFYVSVLFPAKACIDLAYYNSRTFLSDLTWIARSMLAIIGLTTFPIYDRSVLGLDLAPYKIIPEAGVSDS